MPRGLYPIVALLEERLGVLTASQRQGLALWVYGAILAQSACQSAVVSALEMMGSLHSVRQRLREWMYDGVDKAAPCRAQVEPTTCFAALLGWVLTWWQGDQIALALDATTLRGELVILVISVLYRGCAIPVAWKVLPIQQKGSWLPHIQELVEQLAPAVPRTRKRKRKMQVLFMVDRGLWSRSIWTIVRQAGWHPMMRITKKALFTPDGSASMPARLLVTAPGGASPGGASPGGASPGGAWIGHGTVFSSQQSRTQAARMRLSGTLIVIWVQGQEEPWVLLTDLPADRVGASWYALRMWIESGFRVLKSFGWHFERTRRSQPERVSRQWLVMAVACLCALAYGTRVEDAEQTGCSPAYNKAPAAGTVNVEHPRKRMVSIFRRGVSWLQHALMGGKIWKCLWLKPEPYPQPPANIQTILHPPG